MEGSSWGSFAGRAPTRVAQNMAGCMHRRAHSRPCAPRAFIDIGNIGVHTTKVFRERRPLAVHATSVTFVENHGMRATVVHMETRIARMTG